MFRVKKNIELLLMLGGLRPFLECVAPIPWNGSAPDKNEGPRRGGEGGEALLCDTGSKSRLGTHGTIGVYLSLMKIVSEWRSSLTY